MAPLIELYNTTHENLVAWICSTYGVGSGVGFNNPHRARRAACARRLRLYRNEHVVDVNAAIDQIYDTDEYKATLRRFVPFALETNVSQRIVNEVASLYDLPAVRILRDERQRDRFAAEVERTHLDDMMYEAQHLTMLCGETLLWQFTGADKRTKLRVVTADLFDAIPTPGDELAEAGLLIDAAPTTIFQGEAKLKLPHWEVWDDTYRYLINGQGHLVRRDGFPVNAPIAHGLGRIPGVLFHFREPTVSILDASATADIESAHLGVALLEVMIMRLSKAQGEQQPVLSGPLAGLVKGQSMNGEKPLVLPPEVVASMLNMVTDPEHYLKVKKAKLTGVGLTWGMSYEDVMREQAPTSGREFEARRRKLTELRNQQRRRGKRNERATASLMGFDAKGMRTDYQEQAVPQDATEKVSLYEQKAKLGLDSPIAYLQREDPDLSRAEVVDLLKRNLAEYGAYITWVRALNLPTDANANNPGQSAEQNGALGGRPAQPPSDGAASSQTAATDGATATG